MRKVMLVLIILSVGVLQAYRKNVLIENFTATWCTYCPYQAQAIAQLEQVYGESLVVIKYHPSSSDPFYHPHSVTRLYYYNVPGYPTSVIQGNKAVVGGWTGVYTPLNNYVIASYPGESPCSLSVSIFNFDPNTLQAQVRVKVFMTGNPSIPIPSNLRLRIALLEDSIPYTWQNMNILRYVVRRMFPDGNGISLSLARGDSATYEYTFSVSSVLRAPYYYVATFVQNDSIYQIMDYSGSYTLNAGNVIQAAKARLTVNYGYVTSRFAGVDDSNNNRRLERNESGTLRIIFKNNPPFNVAHNINISFVSLDPYLNILNPVHQISTLAAGDSVTVSVNVEALDFPEPHFARIVANYNWDGILSRSDTFSFKVGVDTVLVWDGSGNITVASNIKTYMDSLPFHYEWHSEADSGKPYLYDDYRTILYISGQVIPDTSVINYLKTIINSGKNLIISSQNIAEAANTLDPGFLSSYLGVRFLTPNTGDRKLIGAGFIFEPQDSAIFGGTGAVANQTSKDVIEVISGSAQPVLYYRALSGSDVDSVAGIYRVHSSGSKILHLSFGIEGIGTTGTYLSKRVFMERLFIGLTGINERGGVSAFSSRVLKSGDIVRIPEKTISLRIYSADGKLIRMEKPTSTRVRLNLETGIYFLLIEGEKGSYREKVVIVK
ncbi:MAG: T9SS type A sorting domain-containing protein [Candidatus Hydrothermia bacterium]